MTSSLNVYRAFKAISEQVASQVIGQEHVVKALSIGLLTKGHILLEGLPGTAKTRAVKSLSQALSAQFGRVQFTPDLLPSDVTGSETYQEVDGKPQLNFQPGPIFNNLVLADEINRAPAKVQAALLEAMAEYTITVGGKTHTLPELFMVLATQNPVEQEGTYPLPEAQMDRFMLKVDVAYPTALAEKDIIRLVRAEEQGVNNTLEKSPTDSISPEIVLIAREQVSGVEISELCEDYIVNLIMATREPNAYSEARLASWIDVGVSPRASIALDKCARAHAWLEGRDHVLPDDIRSVAPMVLGHRITLSYDALADGINSTYVVNELLDHVVIG
ncbi:MoxR family ATPase [Vibrio sp. FNV 38]|nr:MoxR family ATPase [Vibrio sp. FNV 38]